MKTVALLPPVQITRSGSGGVIMCNGITVGEIPSPLTALDTLINVIGSMTPPSDFVERGGAELAAMSIAVIREALMKGEDEKDNG